MKTDTSQELRVRILDEAARQFDRKGIKFTMDDLAHALGMSKKTSHEKEVWELMKILTFDEQIQGKIFDYSEGISPLTSLTESEETAKLLRQGTGSRFNMDTLRFVMEKSIMPRYIKGYGEINEQISIAVQSILESSSNLQMEQIIWNRKLNSYLKNLQ